MRLSALAFQATLVIGVTATVGYPQFQEPARPITIWRTAGPVTPRPDLVASDRRMAYGMVSASIPLSGMPEAGLTGTRGSALSQRPGFRDAMPRRSVPIGGRARTALNQPVPFAIVALRNVRTGRIESRTRADQDGRFDFGTFAYGTYVVELLAADGSVIAASELLGTGLIRDAILRVSGNATPRALFGVPGLLAGPTTGTTTGTTSIGSGEINPFFASTAADPLSRAAASGMPQTALPDVEASPRN